MDVLVPRGVETVTIHPQTAGKGRFGAAVGDGADRIIKGCITWPRGSSETSDPSNIVIEGLNVLLPAGTVVDATDEMTARSERWQIEGMPLDYLKNGRSKGILATLKKVGA